MKNELNDSNRALICSFILEEFLANHPEYTAVEYVLSTETKSITDSRDCRTVHVSIDVYDKLTDKTVCGTDIIAKQECVEGNIYITTDVVYFKGRI